MKVTIVAGYFPPEQSADVRLNYDLAYELAESGIETTVVVPFPTRAVSAETQEAYLDKKDERLGPHLRVIRKGKPRRYHQGLVQRGLHFVFTTVSQYRAAKKIETDVYIVVSTPPFLGYAAALLSRKHRVLFKLQDMFPDSLVHSQKLRKGSLAESILKKMESWVYKKVTKIVAVSDDIKNTLLEKNVPESKILVNYDWVDESKCFPVPREQNYLFDQFQLPRENFYVCYAGNIGLLQNIGTIVQAAGIVAKKNKKIKFVIIGDGSWKPALDDMLAKGEHDNIFCFPMQPTDAIAYVYSLGDVGLVSLKPGITQIALPSKTWDILSAGRPVICEIDLYSELCKMIADEECGVCVAPGDAAGMADAVLALYEKADQTCKYGENGRRLIEKRLTRKAATQKYMDFIQALYDSE